MYNRYCSFYIQNKYLWCFFLSYQTHTYCWWLKSCTTWDVWNPINDGIHYLSTGAGFQSTASYISYGQRWPFVGINIFSYSFQPKKSLHPPGPSTFQGIFVRTRSINGVSWFQEKLVVGDIYIYIYIILPIGWVYINHRPHQLKGTRNKHWFQVSWDWWLSLSSKEVDVISLTLPSHLQRVNGHRQVLPSLVGLQNH